MHRKELLKLVNEYLDLAAHGRVFPFNKPNNDSFFTTEEFFCIQQMNSIKQQITANLTITDAHGLLGMWIEANEMNHLFAFIAIN